MLSKRTTEDLKNAAAIKDKKSSLDIVKSNLINS